MKILTTIFIVISTTSILWSQSFKEEALKRPEEVYQTPALQYLNKYEHALQKINLKEQMERLGVPGVSIAVIKSGKLDWVKGYGKIQHGSLVNIDTETMFSKTIEQVLQRHREADPAISPPRADLRV